MTEDIINLVNNLSEDDLVLSDDDGVYLKIGFLATLYFNHAHLEKVRNRVASCFLDYFSLCGDQLKWASFQDKDSWHDLKNEGFITPEQWFSSNQLDENDSWEFEYHGGVNPADASDFSISALGAAKWESETGDLSYLTVHFPLTGFADRKTGLVDFLLNWCNKLQPIHGYAGIGILESPSLSVAQYYEKTVYAISKRFLGIEVDDPLSHVLYLKGGIKGVNWLTVLSEIWLNKLDNSMELIDGLPSEYKTYRYSEGVIIQSGLYPELGDTNRNLNLKSYPKLAQILKPIYIKDHGRMKAYEGFDYEGTMKWIMRLHNL